MVPFVSLLKLDLQDEEILKFRLWRRMGVCEEDFPRHNFNDPVILDQQASTT